jgi:membrane fusion protein (multidrug efflux system)
MDPRTVTLLILSVLTAGFCGLSACGRKADAPTSAPVEVKAIKVEVGPAQLYVDKVGEVRGSQEVDLRARVSGVLMKQEFVDGSLVQEDQPLFSIDAREYRAQLASARAQLAASQANLAHAQQDVDRYAPLLAENAISRQVYDSAVAAAKEARAQVEASRAANEEAQLAVDFATVLAPFSGRMGDAKVFEGALITAGTTLLASLYKDDPAWVYFNVSSCAMALRRARRNSRRSANLRRRALSCPLPCKGVLRRRTFCSFCSAIRRMR